MKCVDPSWFGAKGDDAADDSAALVEAVASIAATGGILDGRNRTYRMETAGLAVNSDDVFIKDATFKRTSELSGYLCRYADKADTTGGGLDNVCFIGNPTVPSGNGGLSMGSKNFKASRYRLDNISADSFSQYGIGIEAGDGWQINGVRVTNHGLTVGKINSCIGFYLYPKLASFGGQLSNIYAEISAASMANKTANHAAVKLQVHDGLQAVNITAVGGSEGCVSIDSIGGRVINLNITPQSGNRPGLAIGNQNTSHDFSGQSFEIDGVFVNGTGTRSLTIGGMAPVVVTAVDGVTDTLTSNNHGLPVNTPVAYTTDGTQIGGLVKEMLYYVINPAANTFQLSASRGGMAINLKEAGSGVHKVQAVKLSNCSLKNIRGERAALLNNASFKCCEFVDWEFASIALDPVAARVTPAVIENTGNVLRNVKVRPTSPSSRFVLKVSDSVVDGCGVMASPGSPVGVVPQIIGQRNRVSNLLGGE